MIEYFVDGSTKDNVIGVGIVKVNEFGFIEKYHFNTEHVKPTSTIAEAYSIEKTLQMIGMDDMNKNELINIYTDSQSLVNCFSFNPDTEYNQSNFFVKNETNNYLAYLRDLYKELNSRKMNYPIYHCEKERIARPLIKVFFKGDLEDIRFLQEAHSLSRSYIKEELPAKKVKVQLTASRKNNKWFIVRNKNNVIGSNKRPLLALSEALLSLETNVQEITLCNQLEIILKTTNKKRLSNDSMKAAFKIIEDHKLKIHQI